MVEYTLEEFIELSRGARETCWWCDRSYEPDLLGTVTVVLGTLSLLGENTVRECCSRSCAHHAIAWTPQTRAKDARFLEQT